MKEAVAAPPVGSRAGVAMSRRGCLIGSGLALMACAVPVSAAAATPDLRDSPQLQAALSRFAGGAAVREGRVEFDLPELVENGNAVPVTVSVASPMSEGDHVAAIALFTGRNPLPEVAEFTLGPRAGRARVATRIRLATSQRVIAAAKLSDGTVWTRTVDVLVTLAACIEE
jgi:sulfur-oxidizing protein SoxY